MIDHEKAWATRILNDIRYIISLRKLPLQPPNIRISEAQNTLGSWNKTSRTISISKNAIQTYLWDAIHEIVKHELAHMYQSDVLHSNGTSHDKSFQKACDVIGVHPAYRHSNVVPGTNGELSTEAQKHYAKIKKLLSLASSSNEHESQLAAQKAHELIIRYNLEHVEQNSTDDDCDYVMLTNGTKKIPIWSKMIANILNHHFCVRVISTSRYVAESDSEERVIELCGRRENIAIAEHCYHFLHATCDRLWKIYKEEHNAPAKHKRSYLVGLMNGLKDKLDSSDTFSHTDILSEAAQPTTSALVLARDTKLNDFFRSRYPRIVKRSSSRSRVQQTAYQAGKTEGKNITINRTIKESCGTTGRFLPHN